MFVLAMESGKVVDLLKVIAQIVAIPAFLIAVWAAIYPVVRHVHLTTIPERQIQLIQTKLESREATAFNILVVIVASGPSERWETIKFDSADVHVPDGRVFRFFCRSYLAEIGGRQQNQSRKLTGVSL